MKLISSCIVLSSLVMLTAEATELQNPQESLRATTVSVSPDGEEKSLFDTDETESKAQTSKISELNRKLIDAQGKISQRTAELNRRLAESEGEISQLRQKLADAEGKITQLQEDLALSEKKYDALLQANVNDSEKEKLKAEVSQLESEKQTISGKLSTLEKEYAELTKKLADKNSYSTQLETKLKELQSELAQVKSEKQEALNRIEMTAQAQESVNELKSVNSLEEILQIEGIKLPKEVNKEILKYKKYKSFFDTSSIPDDLYADQPALHINGNEFGIHLRKFLKAKSINTAGIKELSSDLSTVDLAKRIVTTNVDSLVNYIGKILYANPKERSLNDYLQLLKAIVLAMNNNRHPDMLLIAQTIAREMLLVNKTL